jgi:hypothetical protein
MTHLDNDQIDRTMSAIAERFDQQDEPPPDFSKVPLSMETWSKLAIKPNDNLLGPFNTTTRALIAGDSGLGKTHLGFGKGMAMATGQDFCHWKGRRNSRVLVIDGEMSEDLVQERLADAERRLGIYPEGFFCLCKEHVPAMDPLNTESGQNYLRWLIAHFVALDYIIFDNLGSLIIGSLQNEDDWKPLVPFMFELTAEKIGQTWFTHTGHDASRPYGLKMQGWHMDSVIMMTALEGHPADIAFRLEFQKARQRKPSNRQDYEPVNLILENDQWRTQAAKETKKKTRYGGVQQILMDALDQAIDTMGKCQVQGPIDTGRHGDTTPCQPAGTSPQNTSHEGWTSGRAASHFSQVFWGSTAHSSG